MSSSDNTPSGREDHDDNWGESTDWASSTDFVVSPLSALPALPPPAASVENDIYVPDQTMGLNLVPLPHPSMDNYAPVVSQGTDLYPLPLTHPFLQAVPVGPQVPMDTVSEVQQPDMFDLNVPVMPVTVPHMGPWQSAPYGMTLDPANQWDVFPQPVAVLPRPPGVTQLS